MVSKPLIMNTFKLSSLFNTQFSAVLETFLVWQTSNKNENYRMRHTTYLTDTYKYSSDVNYDNCCEYCGANHANTQSITSSKADKHSDGGTCKCYSKGGSKSWNWYADTYSCSKVEFSGRKKRSLYKGTEGRIKRNTGMEQEVDSQAQEETIVQELKVECLPYDSGKRAYWNYDYTLPRSCWSKK